MLIPDYPFYVRRAILPDGRRFYEAPKNSITDDPNYVTWSKTHISQTARYAFVDGAGMKLTYLPVLRVMADLAPHSCRVCDICGDPLMVGERYLYDINLGPVHASCLGPDRDSYVFLDTEEPIGPDDPIPEGEIWTREDEEDYR